MVYYYELLKNDEYNSIANKHTGLLLLHLNTRGITNKIGDIEILNNQSADIMIFTETWFKDFSNTQCFTGYNDYCQNRADEFGGIAIYVKNMFDFCILPQFSFSVDDYETLCGICNNVLVCAIYRHHVNPCNLFLFLENLLDYCTTYKYQPAILGDFNIDVRNLESSASKHLIQIFELFNCQNYIRSITRPNISNGTTIDLCVSYSETEQLMVHAGTLASSISDHLPTFMILEAVEKPKPKINKVTIRLINESRMQQFTSEISNIDWFSLLSPIRNANEMFEKFSSKLEVLYSNCFPAKEVKSKHNRSRKPYITKHILAHITYRDQLYAKFMKTRDAVYLRLFKQVRNKVNKLILKSKQNYFRTDRNMSNTGKLWKN